MAKALTELQQARQRAASYDGMMARWCDLTGNVPPADCEDPIEHRRNAFRQHLADMAEAARQEMPK